jgi:hypothetical protein
VHGAASARLFECDRHRLGAAARPLARLGDTRRQSRLATGPKEKGRQRRPPPPRFLQCSDSSGRGRGPSVPRRSPTARA